MKIFFAFGLGLIAVLFFSGSAIAQVNVEMGFRAYEITMPADTVYKIVVHDTCGIRTGASVGLDSFEVEWPPIVAFDTRWVTSADIGISPDSLGDGTYLDIRPLPANVAPYIVDHELLYDLLDQSHDTLVLTWSSLPANIDSIHIEDVTVGSDSTVFGRFVQKNITHQSSFPDSLVWGNPALVVIQNLRVRVFYNKSVANPSGVNEYTGSPRFVTLQAFPNPASDHVQFDLPGGSVSRVVLSDMLGRNVLEINKVAMGSGTQELSLAGLPNGLYLISAYGSDQIFRTQIAVLH